MIENMTVIDDHIKNYDPLKRTELERIRAIIRAAAPDAIEVISYGIPAFKYKGKYMIGFEAYKDHLSLFPSGTPIVTFADQLKKYKTSAGTIKFTLATPLPQKLIHDIVTYKMKSIDEHK